MLLAVFIMATLILGLLFSGWFTPMPGKAQPSQPNPTPNVETNCGPQSNGGCVECGPYTNAWTLDYCPSQTNTSGVYPSEIYVCQCDPLTMPTNVVAPIYQNGQKETHTSYDCTNTIFQYAGISYTVGDVKWDPDPTNFPTVLTNTFTANAYAMVTSSDTNMCPSPGRFNIGTCTWNPTSITLDGGDDDDSYALAVKASATSPTCWLTSKSIWWFNGETPPNYPLSTTASVHGAPSGATVTWAVTGPVTPKSGTGSSITLTGTGPSAGQRDVTVKAFVNGKQMCTVFVTVRAPDHQTWLRTTNYANGTGWESDIHYKLCDQFGHVLPYSVGWNEDKDGNRKYSTGAEVSAAAIPDYSGENWPWDEDGGISNADPNDTFDQCIRAGFTIPPTQNPQSPLGGTKVVHTPVGGWYVGSAKIGKGVKVASCVWQLYQDHCVHQ
jgi:hypothetical protein